MKLINENALNPRDDANILEKCLTDSLMIKLGGEAVRPPVQLWETTITEYLRRRPGFVQRQLSDPNSWFFD
jgi:hypothetical protein